MKKTGVACLLFALVAGTFVAPANAAKEPSRKASREAVATYELAWPSSPSTGEGCFGDDNCPTFSVSRSERWVSIDVEDASGTPTAFKIAQITDADDSSTETVGGPFCGSSGKQPVKLTPGARIIIRVYALGDTVCPGSVGTSGRIRAVFSNLP